MKKIKNYFILILVAAVMTSCGGLNKMKKNAGLIKYEVTPKVLEAHAGMVNVTIKGTFPASYFDKKTTVTATPVLTYAGGEVPFEKVQVIQGESVQANNKVISYSGGDFTYTSTIPYSEAIKMSQLMLKVTAVRGKKTIDFEPVKLADGVIATSTLYEKEGKPIMMKDKYVRITPETQMADINYLINSADLRNAELKAEDIALLKEYIKTASADPSRLLKKTLVSSYASPD
jgi:hypothetical protein